MVSVAFRTLALGLVVLGLCACGANGEETPAVGAIGAAVAWSPDERWISWGEDGRIWIARSDTHARRYCTRARHSGASTRGGLGRGCCGTACDLDELVEARGGPDRLA
jgi:hypothetical protein